MNLCRFATTSRFGLRNHDAAVRTIQGAWRTKGRREQRVELRAEVSCGGFLMFVDWVRDGNRCACAVRRRSSFFMCVPTQKRKEAAKAIQQFFRRRKEERR